MVPCLHQSNVYIKTKLRVWRVIKCIPLIGTKTSLTCAGLQTTPSHVCQYRADNEKFVENMVYFYSWYHVCAKAMFIFKRKLRVLRLQKCIPLVGAKTSLTCAELQTTPSHVCQYRAENEICGNPGLRLPMVPCLHQSNVYIKRKLRIWRVIKCIPLIGTKASLTCAGLQTTLSQVSQYRAENGNLRKSGSTISHGTMCAPKQCLSQKETTGIKTPKMYFSRRCKNVTYCAELQTTTSQVCQYRAENEIC